LILTVEFQSDGDDLERVALTRRLRTEILSLGAIETVEPVAMAQTAHSKAVAGSDWSALLVTLAASGGVLTTLIGTLKTWLVRREKASITLELGDDKLVITGASEENQQRLIDSWIHRHSD
jgi:hypothetical protein